MPRDRRLAIARITCRNAGACKVRRVFVWFNVRGWTFAAKGRVQQQIAQGGSAVVRARVPANAYRNLTRAQSGNVVVYIRVTSSGDTESERTLRSTLRLP